MHLEHCVAVIVSNLTGFDLCFTCDMFQLLCELNGPLWLKDHAIELLSSMRATKSNDVFWSHQSWLLMLTSESTSDMHVASQ